MANEIQTENIKAFQKAVAENRVEQARLATDGAITINRVQEKLTSVDIADVDLVLGFDDGSFVIIPSGALDATVNPAHTVSFTETKETLANLFKLAGLSNPAKAGSLRVVTENIDSARLIEEEPGRPATDEYQAPELPAPPAPVAKVSAGASLGKGPGLGGHGSGEGEGEVPATVLPTVTPQPPVYRSGTATQTPVTQPDFGDSGPPVVTAAMYTSSSFKVTPSGRTDLPAGAYDPALANDPTALAVHSSPANQSVIEKIYGTAGNDVINHNSSFNNSSDPAIWSKSIHLSFSNFATVETVTLTLNATQIAKIAGFNLEGTGVTKVAGFANVWTVDLTQHPDYKTSGIDVAVRYPVGDAVNPVDFIADLSVHGTGQVASGELIPVDLTSQMKITWRNAVTADDFNVIDATDNSQMMVLPAAGLGYEIYGGDGNDEIHAGAGNDILHGGKGADKLDGGIGSDTATYIDIDAVTGITADLAQIANNTGEALGDEYTSIENLEGSTYSDILRGDSGVNRLTGLAGDDTLEGRGGVYVDSQGTVHGDILDGGIGNDTASYASDTTGVTVSLLTNTGTGGDAAGDTLINIENLAGGSGNDTLTGNEGNNILTGNAGNDSLTGGLGADSLFGGDGTDTADYSQATAPVVVTLASVTGVTQSGEAEGDTFDSIENIVGTAFGDHLIGNSVANQLSGGTGNDLLEGLGGSDKLIGGDGSDTASYAHAGTVSGSTGVTASLTASSGFTQGTVPTPSGDAAGDTYDSIENLEGSAYNDTLIGNGNANILSGGAGNDTLEGMAGSDQLHGDGGINTASYEHWEGAFGAGIIASLTNPASNTGDAAGDTYFDIQNLTGSNFNDTLTGDSGSNTLNGGAGDDFLEGMAEADILNGGVSGSDTAVYSQATTAVTASLMDAAADNSGTDAAGDTYISIENLTGSSHDDTLIGKTGSNILIGGAGNDVLEGMAGSDQLIGGSGSHDVASYSRAGLNSSGSDTTAIGLGVTATLTSVFNAGAQVSGSGDAAGDSYSGIEDLTGSSYNDTLIGDSADNILTGGLGNDKLEGMGGADTLIGGTDPADLNNTASYAHANAVSGGTGVTVSLTTPTTSNTGDAFGDTYFNIRNLEGSIFDDRLQGDEFDNTLSGLSGDDLLEGMAGADRLEGGAGSNTASYANSGAVSGSIGITASLLTPLDPTGNTGDATGDTYSQIQNLLGSAYDDTLTGDAGDNRLDGAAGNDLLTGGVGADQLIGGTDSQTGSGATLAGGDTAGYSTSSTDVVASLTSGFDFGPTIYQSGDAYGDTFSGIENLNGSSHNDTLIGNGNQNILSGSDGNDILEGMAGADRLIGGIGSNTASYAHAGYTEPTQTTGITASLTDQSANTGDATGDYYEDIQNLLGSDYNDILIGNTGDNTLSGGKGNDILEGLDGADYLVGGAGSDYASYAHSATGITASLTDPTQNSVGTDAEGDTYDSIENQIGSAHNDILIGNSQANILLGGSGDDVLEGMAGADQLDGGEAGNNTASYEHWVDTSGIGVVASLSNPSSNTGDAAGDTYINIQNLTGSYFNDTLTGNDGGNILTGGAGNDILEGRAGADKLIGEDGSDTASYSLANTDIAASLLDSTANSGTDAAGDTYDRIENLTAGAGNDTLIGTSGINILTGGAGNDILEGMKDADQLVGGDGDHDVASYAHAGLTASGLNTFGTGTGVVASFTTLFTAGAAVITSGDAAGDTYSGIEDLTGSDYNDTLIGNSGANIITGGTGDDKLEGMAGADTLIGGIGTDVNNTASYAHAGAISGSTGVFASLLTPLDPTGNTGDAAGDTYSNIRHLEGSTFDDTLQGDENTNTLTGLAGDDVLEGMGGADTLNGGTGNNTASYEHSPHDTTGAQVGVIASLTTNSGTGADAQGDTFAAGTIQNLIGSGFDDQLTGDAENNRLNGLAGNDLLEGMAGADRLDGGEGNDTLIGGSGADQLIGGIHNQTGSGVSLTGGDTASYAGGSAVLASLTTDFAYGQTIIQTGDAYNDTFDGIENLTGSDHNDILIGNSGDNILSGGLGDDVLEGMAGADLLIGGTGSDLNNTASYAHAGPAGITAALSSVGVSNTGDAAGDAYQNISNLLGSDYNDTLIGSTDANILTGGLGNDILEGLAGADSLIGGDGSDTASYVHAAASGLLGVTASLNDYTQNIGVDAVGDTYNSIENLTGSSYNDTLTGDGGMNILSGGAGDDLLEGLGNADTLIGGADNDTASYAHATTYVVASLTTGLIGFSAAGDAAGDSYDSIENLTGSNYGDTLIGNSADPAHSITGINHLSGGDGDDILEGMGGADLLDGGTGNNTASYEHSSFNVTASLTTPTSNTNDAEGDSYSNISNLIGSAHNDILIGDGNANTLTGGAGDDSISGLGGVDTLYGGEGNDTLTDDLTGTAKIYGEAGDDTIIFTGYDSGTNTNDFFDGGTGSDTLVSQYAGTGQTTVNFFAGTISYPAGSGTITNIENFTASGSNTAYVYANSVDNVVTGGSTLNDYIDYRNATGGVAVNLTTGVVTGASGNDTLISIENIVGTQWSDTLIGNSSANTIRGSYGADIIDGGSANNAVDNNDTWYVDWSNAATIASLLTADQNRAMGIVMTGDAAGDVVTNMENITASNGDLVYGNELNNNLYGRGLLEGFAGNDYIRAQNSLTAYASYANAGDSRLVGITTQVGVGVTVNLTTTAFTYGSAVTNLGDAAGDTYQNINNVQGSAFNDIIIGNASANILRGGDGDDILEGLDGADTFYGGAGNDTVSYAHAAPVSGSTGGVTVKLYTNISSANGDATGDIFSEIENITGSNFNDSLTGDEFNNILTGGLGSDILDGGSGGIDTANYADAPGPITVDLAAGTVSCGTDTDTLINIERIIGSAYADTINGSAGADWIDMGSGGSGVADIVDGKAGVDTISFAAATSAVTVALNDAADTAATVGGFATGKTIKNIENMVGGMYNDTLTGNSGDNTIYGGLGNNTLDGGAQGSGGDTVTYANSSSAVVVSLLANTATHDSIYTDTLSNFENITGSSYDDTLTGNSGDNILDGGAGNNTFKGGGGTDIFKGGAGIDTVSYTDYTSSVTANLTTDTTHFLSIENLIGSSHDDTMTGTSGNNIIDGGNGNDTLTGGGGLDTVSYATHSAGVTVDLANASAVCGTEHDTVSGFTNVTGSLYADSLTGDGNANLFDGYGGGDSFLGGLGNDTVSYASLHHASPLITDGVTANLNTSLATYNDSLEHSVTDHYTSIEHLTGSDYNDFLTGDGGDNILNGGAGNDTLLGGIGSDTLIGGSGTDTASYAGAGSTVTVSLALTTAQNTVGAGTDTLSSIENLTGSDWNDTLTGDSNSNTLIGGLGNDTLTGNDGNDILDMRSGRDTASGGNGDDTFLIDASNSSNLPTYADGGANTSWAYGGGDAVKLITLGASYSLNSLFTFSTYDTNIIRNMEILDIRSDGASTSLTVTSTDVQSFMDSGTASQIWIKADSGDSLNVSAAAGETVTHSTGSTGMTDYTIFNASGTQVAQIHWQTA